MKLHIHKWKYVRRYNQYTFEGVAHEDYETPYRICARCGRVHKWLRGARSGNWSALTNKETQVLTKIAKDMGDYYII